MIPLSNIFTPTMRYAFSYRSASWPAVAEKRKKGRMKIPPARTTSCSLESPQSWADLNVIRITSAFLKKLSLNAPRSCVKKIGQKRRSRKSRLVLMQLYLNRLQLSPQTASRASVYSPKEAESSIRREAFTPRSFWRSLPSSRSEEHTSE